MSEEHSAVPSSSEAGGKGSLQWEEALRNLEGDEKLLHELATMFLQQYPELVKEIEIALQAEDAKEVRRGAHTLKSSAKVVGAVDAGAAALVVENFGRDKELELASEALTPLKQQLELVRPAIEAALQEG